LVVFHGWFWFSLYVDVKKRLGVVLAYDPALFENRVIDAEIFLPQLPQDQRSGIDPRQSLVNGLGP
jgi:hypothetical protein